jgi:threonine dehydratase
MIAVRDSLGLKTKIIGVVSSHANAYAQSFQSHQIIESPSTTQLADGMACRTPNPDALEIIRKGVDHIVEVSDEEVAEAMQTLFVCTHNVSEGAGAASVAASLKEKDQNAGKKIAAILTGGNVDKEVFARILITFEPTH